ncbi:amidohydrolase family protein [Marilutibacter maris]|uniref:Amidohydrolase-related domain-containing protein n=1 Tax=Marilutibacter maris TaxID=1605891 RepID=A0A2U9T9H0_9GAMM|nr:amidohydrolase family protein [Lysobacter maris]AWV07198.1 hypothetical protein C9I47_1497 [Lysobacter maris]
MTILAVLLATLAMAGAASAQPGPPDGDPAADAATTVILAGHLIAEPGRPAAGPHTLVVRDGRIQRIVPGTDPAAAGEPAQVIDLGRSWLMPGLIDLHMHLGISMHADPGTAGDEARMALLVAAYAGELVRAGVTTVRDVGDNGGVVFAVRDAIDAGRLPGPRILAAGRVVSRSGGHGARRPQPGEIPYEPAACDGRESCRRVVRENIEQGSDWIKMTVSGSGRESGGRPDAAPIMFEDEVRGAVDAAHQAGRPVAAHAHSTPAIALALQAGADTIEHGTYFDDAAAARFKRGGAYLVPTAFVADYVGSQLQTFAGGRDGKPAEELGRWAEAAVANPGRAWRAGVPLALGTDAGPSFAVSATAREIALYVAAGVPAAAALEAATVNNADALRMGDRLGRLREGYLADMIALESDPNVETATLSAPRWVMKAGRVVCDRDCVMGTQQEPATGNRTHEDRAERDASR